jgi:hypothetical protein
VGVGVGERAASSGTRSITFSTSNTCFFACTRGHVRRACCASAAPGPAGFLPCLHVGQGEQRGLRGLLQEVLEGLAGQHRQTHRLSHEPHQLQHTYTHGGRR